MFKHWVSFFLLFSMAFAAAPLKGVLDEESNISYIGSANEGENTWDAVAPVETLRLRFDPEDVAGSLELEVVVKSADFDGGNWILNGNSRNLVFESKTYPDIVFRSTSTDLKRLNEGQNQARITGLLSLHGVEKEVSIDINLLLQGSTLHTTGQMRVLLSDYNMKRPSGFGFTIDDEVVVSLDIRSILSE